MKRIKKCIRWVQICWSEPAEAWLLDFRFETAPPGNEWIHMGLGHEEMKELHQKLGRALRTGKKRMAG